VKAARPRPDFFVIGAAKAATTSLCDLVSSHPDVFFCPIKEPGFFTYAYDRGPDWYASLFADDGGALAVGEGSTTYSQTGVWPRTVERMADWAPDARIIYVVREPLERMQSHWVQWRVEGRIGPGPFARAVREVPALLDASLYWKQISAYRERYPDERIKVLFFEDFIARPEDVVREVFEFLGLDHDIALPDPTQARNPSRDHRMPMRSGRLLGRIRGYPEIRRRSPMWLRRVVAPLLSTPFSEQPQWDEASRTWAIEHIAPDARRFLEFCRKPPDFWPVATGGTRSGPLESRRHSEAH
jgi:Sulfotransferase domain